MRKEGWDGFQDSGPGTLGLGSSVGTETAADVFPSRSIAVRFSIAAAIPEQWLNPAASGAILV